MLMVLTLILFKYIFSYLQGRKQNVEIKNTYSVFQVLLSGVPQGSILGFILFTIWIENAELHNFPDDNTFSWTETIKCLTSESEKSCAMVQRKHHDCKPDKFQAIIIDRKKQQNNPISTKTNDININSENSVRLL